MLTSSGASGASSSSSAGRKRYDGHGLVTSLTTIAAAARRGRELREARRADGLRQGAPDLGLLVLGRRRRRRRLLFAQAAAGADDGDLQVVGQDGVESAVAVRDGDLHPPLPGRQPKRTADSLSASMTGIGLPLRNCTMAPPAVHT